MISNEISRHKNRISIKGPVTSFHIRGLCARLYDAIEKRRFQDIVLIRMRNVDMTVGGLIDRAIVQRTKLGNGDAKESR